MMLTRTIFIFAIIAFVTNTPAEASINPRYATFPPDNTSLQHFASMRIKEAQQLAGRKFTFKEKVGFKLLQWKIRKQLRTKVNDKSSGKATVALWLSILSLATILLPLVSVPLAIAAIIFGARAQKQSDYRSKKARIAIDLAILSLAITVVAYLIIAIFVSDGTFGIFILD
jgi:hypothetical protein